MLSADEVASVNPLNLHMSSILFEGIMVPNKEEDYILLLGNSILYKEYYLTRFNHQKTTHMGIFLLRKTREPRKVAAVESSGSGCKVAPNP